MVRFIVKQCKINENRSGSSVSPAYGLKSYTLVLGATKPVKVTLITSVTADLTDRVKAGGTQLDQLPGAVRSVTSWFGEKPA